ncbi:MAG TPA: hypothetical protein VF765_34680 [Polyangiaceae bacterium]
MTRSRLLAPVAGALVTCAASITQAADPPAFELGIACPSMAEGDRAALEARARAELAASAPGADERWQVACADGAATLTWRRGDGTVSTRTVTLTGEAAAADLDRILEGLHALIAGREIELPGASAPGAARTGDAGASGRGESPPVQVPARALLGVLVGGDAELWEGSIGWALGFHAGVRLRLGATWSVLVALGTEWGLGTAAGASAWTLRGAARIEDEVVPHLLVGAGVGSRVLWASLAGSGGGPVVGATAGAMISAKLAWSAGPIVLSGGPQLEAMVRPVAVDVSGTEAFRIPTWVGSLALEVETR